MFVVGIQHRAITRNLDHDALDLGELFERIDPLESQVVRLHVQYRRDVGERHAHAGAQQAAARNFQHRDIDARVGEHHSRRDRPGHVAFDGALAVDVHPVRGGQSRSEARHFGNVREHARGGGLAVGAGDAGDRNPSRRAGREQHFDHRAGRIARRAFARRHVHAKSGRRVHLAYPPPTVL